MVLVVHSRDVLIRRGLWPCGPDQPIKLGSESMGRANSIKAHHPSFTWVVYASNCHLRGQCGVFTVISGKWNHILSMLGAEIAIVHKTPLFSQLSVYKASSEKTKIPTTYSLVPWQREDPYFCTHGVAGRKQTYTDTTKPPTPEAERLLAEQVT